MATGYTKVPNDILDAMGELSPAAFKLAIALCRLTYGYHRDSVVMSLPEIQKLTGLSKQGVINAAGQIEAFFTRERQGHEIVWKVKSVDSAKSNQLTLDDTKVNTVDRESQLSVPPTSGSKENYKEIRTDTNVSDSTAVESTQAALFTLPDRPAKAKPNGKRPKSPAEQEAAERTKELMALYAEALGCPVPSYPQEGAAAKRILKHYTAADAIGCYHWLKAKPFWHGQHLSLASVHKQIGEWVKAGRPKPNGANGANGANRLWVDEFLPYLNGNKPFAELSPLTQAAIREQGESVIKRQPTGVTKNHFDTFISTRH